MDLDYLELYSLEELEQISFDLLGFIEKEEKSIRFLNDLLASVRAEINRQENMLRWN